METPNSSRFQYRRKSLMEFNEVYFWTDTIYQWKHLLVQDKYKTCIISSWLELVQREQIAIYAFVIMPNHLHLVWEMLQPNGKEMPYASFNKYTSHQFLADLRLHHPNALPYFKVNEKERNYRFWQRDAFAIPLNSVYVAEQKIDYIHNNPLQEHWNLAQRPEEYRWSSARFYETGENEWGFLTHYMDRFRG